MKLVPLQQWICDGCHRIIDSAQAGRLEWLDDNFKGYGFRIVHHSEQCRYPKTADRSDIYLTGVVGEDGLARLLSLLTPGAERDPRGEYGARSCSEWAELVRRLLTPHYEEARQYWSEAEADNFFDGANEYWPYLQDTLKAVIARYSPEQ